MSSRQGSRVGKRPWRTNKELPSDLGSPGLQIRCEGERHICFGTRRGARVNVSKREEERVKDKPRLENEGMIRRDRRFSLEDIKTSGEYFSSFQSCSKSY